MAEMKWSQNQRDAIFTKYSKSGKRCNILVSAAAGSGKTAVLVQRIIEKLVPENISESIDANKLIVVTFTNAAAHEMSERIKKSLDENLKEAYKNGDIPRQNLIKKQQLLILDSEITTIDAFCMRLIRKYFNLLDIAPDFSVSDEVQTELLKDDAMDELFSELYEEKDSEFFMLLRMYASSRSDSGLKTLIKHIYDFVIKMPDPFLWLHENTEALLLSDGLKSAPWYEKSCNTSNSNICTAFALAKEALEFISGTSDIDAVVAANPPEKGNEFYDEWRYYYNLFYTYYVALKPLCNIDSKKQSAFLQSFTLPSLGNSPKVSIEDREYLKPYNTKIHALVAEAKNLLSPVQESFLELSREKLYPAANALAKITERFSQKLFEMELSKNLLSFSDIEQLAYNLLSKNPDISDEIKSQYDEVLMDEYQDTSLLQEAIFSYVANGKNLFTVGDMKQSIYRFRSSDPTLFKARLDHSSFDEESTDRKIILSQNFRSRAEVLDSINDVFSAIMSEDAGELDYDESQRLYAGNTDYTDTGFDFKSECIVIDSEINDTNEAEDISKITLEARFIASEISRLKEEHFKVTDKSGIREIKNRDIVILMSSHKRAADIFTAELNARGIECFAQQEGYFSRNEIQLMLALFKVIGNPNSDIPLVSVLRSPIGTFSDNELATIRCCKKGKFFSALKELIRLKNDGLLEIEDDIKTAEKAELFYSKLCRWRDYARYMPSDKLIWTLYEETDYYAFCGAMYGGDEAQANLRLLFERAKQYESYGFRGLFGFVKYMDRFKSQKKDLSSAKLIGENHDVVRIMTIHKSKGLEFPVVFIAGGGNNFMRRLDSSRFVMHKDYGIALDYVDFDKNYTLTTPLKEFFRKTSYFEQTSEDIRKLYVAMTRAREKLYFVASAANPEITELSGGKLDPASVLSAKSFCDMVLPVAAASENWHVKRVTYDMLKPIPALENSEIEGVEINIPDVERLLGFKYPYPDVSSVASKVSVSELKSQKNTEIIPAPAFLSEKKQSGAGYGTLMHTVLKYLVPKNDMDLEYVKNTVLNLVQSEIISQEDAELINPKKFLDFYNSEIGMRIIKSDNVYREQPFELLVPLSLVYPDIKDADDEKIILQGVIDCWFTEGNEIVLVDYKTDSFSDISEIHEKYDRQLELYAFALKKITKKDIKSKNIYLFYNNSVIQC